MTARLNELVSTANGKLTIKKSQDDDHLVEVSVKFADGSQEYTRRRDGKERVAYCKAVSRMIEKLSERAES